MRQFFLLLGLVIALAGGMVWYYFSDGQAKQRLLRQSFTEIETIVETNDRAKIAEMLTRYLTDDAKIHLTVDFFIIGGTKPMEQDFDKASFTRFIDNILYSLERYSYHPRANIVEPDTGTVQFTSVEIAEGANKMGGISIDMNYRSNTGCTGKAVFENNSVRFSELRCKTQFTQMPKAGQEGKLLNQQDLMNLMQR